MEVGDLPRLSVRHAAKLTCLFLNHYCGGQRREKGPRTLTGESETRGVTAIGSANRACPPLDHKRTFRVAIVMSALGQKRTHAVQQTMSALPPKATSNATWDCLFRPNSGHRSNYDRSGKYHRHTRQNHPDFGELARPCIDFD